MMKTLSGLQGSWQYIVLSFLVLDGAIASFNCAKAQTSSDFNMVAKISIFMQIKINGLPSNQLYGRTRC